MRVLVTGGAGYLGSHTVLELIEQGFEPIVVDNLINSSRESLNRVTELSGVEVPFFELDVADTAALIAVLAAHPCEAAIHFAGLKAVGESVAKPLMYYRNNLDSTISLVEAMLATLPEGTLPGIIFSSSATVYGADAPIPYTEATPAGVGITNPYAWTKFMGEQILADAAKANPGMQAVSLRYFNPIGAHPSGRMGEDPRATPNNLAPYIAQVAVGRLERVGIFGNDYPTVDGTGVRDYIHVMDLAAGHVAALALTEPGFHAINLGTGRGTSVLELLAAFEAAVGAPIPSAVLPRRAGDLAEFYADTAMAAEVLGWRASRTIAEACADTWRWQSANPNGYGG
jgi:UDP-glucose 4-epimerase